MNELLEIWNSGKTGYYSKKTFNFGSSKVLNFVKICLDIVLRADVEIYDI